MAVILNIEKCHGKKFLEKKIHVSDEETAEFVDKESTEDDLIWDGFLPGSRKFTNEELILLIDSLLFSKHIPYSQAKDLIAKLEFVI